MKIALVHDFLLRFGGAERVLKVFSEMYPDAPIYTLMYNEKTMGKHFPRERVITGSMQKWARLPGRLYRFFFSSMPMAIEEFDFAGYDVVLSSSTSYAHGVLTPQKTKHISYCHSPSRYLWDYTHQYIEDHGYSGLSKFFIHRKMQYVREWDRLASDRPDYYLANSHNIQRRISKYYGRESDVIYPPVDVDRFTVSSESEDFFLIVSQLSPYKRVDLAVQLFNKLGKRLIIIGAGPQERFLKEIAAPNVEILGSKSDAEVAEYMKYCRAVIFPGEDDFGIVPIEAMACGKTRTGIWRWWSARDGHSWSYG
jgi:glycosyltransferase involved in cell wall biosynthesis